MNQIAKASDGQEPERFSEAPSIEIGQWYWVKKAKNRSSYDDEPGIQEDEWFACVMDLGSNYIYLESPKKGIHGGMSTTRVHLNDFARRCRRELDPTGFIRTRIGHYRGRTEMLLAEIRDITANLGVTPVTGIEEQTAGETRALSTRNATTADMKSYKKQLIVVKEKKLPDLFKQVEESNGWLASWMSAETKPMEAQVSRFKGCIEAVNERIFHVELYAGLTEEIVKIRDGKPADSHEKVKLMQGRLYMDEECLLDYDAGGMEFKNIKQFDEWLLRPHNLNSALPHQRCMVAFQVRRHLKTRAVENIVSHAHICFYLEKADKLTFLYIRNGEQVFRISTEIELRSDLFPDVSEFDFSQPTVASTGRGFSSDKISILTVSDWEEQKEKARLAELARQERSRQWVKENKAKGKDKKDEFFNPHDRSSFSSGEGLDSYHPFDSTNVYYDDIKNSIEEDMKYYNRVVLILQGLFDRSPVFAPHFPAQLWSTEGFGRVVELVYDHDRALYAGEKPDFEAFRAQLNASLRPGSVVAGINYAWAKQQEEEEEKRGGAKYDRHGNRIQRYQRYSDRGPSAFETVTSVKGDKVTCEYVKAREKSVRPNRWSPSLEGMEAGDPMTVTYTTQRSNVLNVSAYTPGDYKMFFADPRTRSEYLKWAPFLLGAEDFIAGKKKADEVRMREW